MSQPKTNTIDDTGHPIDPGKGWMLPTQPDYYVQPSDEWSRADFSVWSVCGSGAGSIGGRLEFVVALGYRIRRRVDMGHIVVGYVGDYVERVRTFDTEAEAKAWSDGFSAAVSLLDSDGGTSTPEEIEEDSEWDVEGMSERYAKSRMKLRDRIRRSIVAGQPVE